jgi:2-polyprenyl-6-methoxyphenol hydroxylase-like FAD-dependent oxidoreductase
VQRDYKHISMKSISIIGAGIGGLTTALTLKRRGLNPMVYEAAEEIRPVGAGIMMANNAMQVFEGLGVREKIETAGNYISDLRITDAQLKDISVVSFKPFEEKYGVRNVAIHRGALQKILAEELGYEHIALGKRLQTIERQEPFSLLFEDGTSVDSAILIGADGIKSTVREQLITKGEIRSAGQICWRGLCEYNLPEKYSHAGVEAWGKGKRFGFTRIDQKRVYWYAVVSTHLVKEDFLSLFLDFDSEVRNIIIATPENQIIKNDIIDLKPISVWQDKNVCLIGDAAHATTPNMGQGACQAVEDAYVLGKLLDKGFQLEETFRQYQEIRSKKAHWIVNNSSLLGKVSHWENPLAIGLRNFLMRIGSKANSKQLEKVFELG